MSIEKQTQQVAKVANDFAFIAQEIARLKDIARETNNSLENWDTVAGKICYWIVNAYEEMQKAIATNMCCLAKD